MESLGRIRLVSISSTLLFPMMADFHAIADGSAVSVCLFVVLLFCETKSIEDGRG